MNNVLKELHLFKDGFTFMLKYLLILFFLIKVCHCVDNLDTEKEYNIFSHHLDYCMIAKTPEEFKHNYDLLREGLEKTPFSIWIMKNPNKERIDKRSLLDKIIKYSYGSYNVIDGSSSWGPCYQRDHTKYYLDLLTQYSRRVNSIKKESLKELKQEEVLTLLNPRILT